MSSHIVITDMTKLLMHSTFLNRLPCLNKSKGNEIKYLFVSQSEEYGSSQQDLMHA